MKFSFKGKKVLVISDMHLPYQHKDAMRFLRALAKKYGFDLVVSVGDLGDFHDMSFHDSDPDLLSAGDEHKQLQRLSRELEKIFPEMIILGSNHGDLPARKAFAAKMPKAFLRPYNDIYGVGKGWKFVDDLTLVDGRLVVYGAHGISKSGVKLAAQRGVCVFQGHYHTEFRIDYVSNPRDLLWSMQVGCLIDRRSLAFNYNKLDLSRPIIGCGMIEDGRPRLLPMPLNEAGDWTGVIP